MHILHTTSSEAFVQQSMTTIADIIRAATDHRETAIVGLSGGSTPQPIYTMLAGDTTIPWAQVRFFLVDERYVPPNHKDSNQRMIRSTLLTGPASVATLLAPDTSLPPPQCIDAYAALLQGLNPDLVILGMGSDGHIASLFPPLEPEAFGPRTVIHATTKFFDLPDRITVTLPILENAAKRIFLITGQEKKALLEKMQDTQDVTMTPAVALFDERTTWMVGP